MRSEFILVFALCSWQNDAGNVGDFRENLFLKFEDALFCEAFRENAYEPLAGLIGTGCDRRRIVRLLLIALKKNDRWVQLQAIRCLGRVGVGVQQALPELFQAIKDPRIETEVRVELIELIGRVSKPSSVRFPLLMIQITDRE